MRVKTVPGGTTYTGPYTNDPYKGGLSPDDREGHEKLAALGNKKAEELGLKVRYEVED